ncbi:MAG TPA: hypothetical protein VFS67_13625 [Polyangiaceae bacterium]|jgi:hypothetical protein|nr:hypothetical protein [Polyangiaceae bacterium]
MKLLSAAARVLRPLLAVPLLAVPLLACSYFVSRGSDLYYQGRYIEAAQVLEQTEYRLERSQEPDQHAEYGLYRGATLLRLGDLDGAQRWLEYAQHWEQRHPGALRDDERDLLEERLLALQGDLERRQAIQEGQALAAEGLQGSRAAAVQGFGGGGAPVTGARSVQRRAPARVAPNVLDP